MLKRYHSPIIIFSVVVHARLQFEGARFAFQPLFSKLPVAFHIFSRQWAYTGMHFQMIMPYKANSILYNASVSVRFGCGRSQVRSSGGSYQNLLKCYLWLTSLVISTDWLASVYIYIAASSPRIV